MTANKQVAQLEVVIARALARDWRGLGSRNFPRDLAEEIAAMQPAPVTVTTVEEFEALANYTPAMDMSKDVCMWVVDSDGERRLSSSFAGIMTPEETPEMVIDFPATVLYPTAPQADVLHITGPSETGDLAPMLCGITKVVETPRSPEQPVCQACAAIQTSERNDLDHRAKAQRRAGRGAGVV